MATKFTYKSVIGREMGCGAGDPPNAKTIVKKKGFKILPKVRHDLSVHQEYRIEDSIAFCSFL
jgi:hypothetical protein